MLEERIIYCLNNLITNTYRANKNMHYSLIGEHIYKVLIDDDTYSKRMFYDNFKSVQINDKKVIVNICISIIVNKIYELLINIDKNKIKLLTNYIENNKNLISSIPTIIHNENYSDLNDDLKIIADLNSNEKLFCISMCINYMSFGIGTIMLDIDTIKENKNEFFSDISKYKNLIIQLFNFYTPIYMGMQRFKNNKIPLDTNYNEEYIEISSFTTLVKRLIISKNIDSIIFRPYYTKEIIYYIIYKFLLCKDSIPNLDANLVKNVYRVLGENSIAIDDNMLRKLTDYFNFSLEYFSDEEQIEKVKYLYTCNLNSLIQLYAKIDIGEYNIL